MVLKAHAGRLRVHELACEFAADAVRLARTFRGPGRFERGDQLVRAALSICSNIAEACGRGTVAEFRQFLLYARSEEHTSELQSPCNLVCRLLLENKKKLVRLHAPA